MNSVSSKAGGISLFLAVLMAISSLTAVFSGEALAATKSKAGIEKAAESGAAVNVNTAALDELQGVRGLGPVLAQRIIDYRSIHGSFARVDDLVQVPGIGSAKLQKIRDQISI